MSSTVRRAAIYSLLFVSSALYLLFNYYVSAVDDLSVEQYLPVGRIASTGWALVTLFSLDALLADCRNPRLRTHRRELSRH
jgi:hypothetical protein